MDNMKEIKGNNNSVIKIGVAPWQDAVRLKNAVSRDLAKVGIDLDGITLKTEINAALIQKLIKPFMTIDSSEEFNTAVFKCMTRCTYNDDRITEQTFENVEAREDYYLIMLQVLTVNLAPFFKGLVSGLPN